MIIPVPGNWTEDDFVGQKKSKPHNPGIANVFYRAGYIEAWGRGISKIFSACEKYGIDSPEYKIDGDSITLVFTASENIGIKSQIKVQNETLNETLIGQMDGGRSPGKSRDTELQGMGLKSQIKVHDDHLNETLKISILSHVASESKVTYVELAEAMGVSLSTIKRYMKQMQLNGEVYREGSKKTGKWMLPG